MTTPSFDPDDPRLTAYALGEADEAARLAVEALLAQSAEARAEVELTRAFARAITAEYAREQAEYLNAKPVAESPSNIVAFPGAGRRWQRGIGPGLKAAAMLFLAASLVYLTLRRPRREEAVQVASTQISAPAVPAGSPLVTLNARLDDALPPAKDANDLNSGRVVTLEQQAAATPAPILTSYPSPRTADTATFLAATSRQVSGGEQESAARARSLPVAPAVAAPPSDRRDAAAVQARAPGAVDKPVGAPVPAPDARVAQSVVRVRSSAGVFASGVIVSTDGLILSIAPSPGLAMPPPLTVRLADQREFPATVAPEPGPAGWYWLRIDAGVVPAVALAAEVPARNTPLVLPTVDPQSGNVTFANLGPLEADGSGDQSMATRSPQAASAAAFAFNSADELLLIERPAALKTFARSKATTEKAGTPQPFARPLTAAERETLRRARER